MKSRPHSLSLKKAALVNAAAKYSSALIQLLYTVVLARILTPEEFGVVAIAQVFVVFFTIFTDMGLGAAIVQKRDLSSDAIRSLAGFSFILGIVLGILFALCGYPISYLYSIETLLPICTALSVSLVFTAWNIVPNALLQKEMRFIEIGVRQVVSCAFATVLSVACACWGWGVYAIVIFSVAGSFVVLVWNIATTRLIPRFSGMRSSVRAIFSYSSGLFGANLINYFYRNLDNLVIGFVYGSAKLGQYSKAYQLTTYPQTYLTAAIEPVLHPILANKQDDVSYIYETYIKVSKALSLIGMFVTVFAFFCAGDIIWVFYGSQWGEAVPCFQLLALSVWAQMVSGTAGAMFRVLGKPFEQLKRSLIICAATFVCVGAGVWVNSIEGIAGFMVVSFYIAFFTLGHFLIKRSFYMSSIRFYRAFLPDVTIGVVFAAIMWGMSLLAMPNPFISLLVKLLLAIPIYCILLIATSQFIWVAALLPDAMVKRFPSWLKRGAKEDARRG